MQIKNDYQKRRFIESVERYKATLELVKGITSFRVEPEDNQYVTKAVAEAKNQYAEGLFVEGAKLLDSTTKGIRMNFARYIKGAVRFVTPKIVEIIRSNEYCDIIKIKAQSVIDNFENTLLIEEGIEDFSKRLAALAEVQSIIQNARALQTEHDRLLQEKFENKPRPAGTREAEQYDKYHQRRQEAARRTRQARLDELQELGL